jgi:hypothetical protein
MAHDKVIEVKIVGAGIFPGSIRSKEIAELIDAIEEMIASVVIRKNPDLQKKMVSIGLKEIKNGSLILEFAPNLLELTIPAVNQVGKSIAENNFSSLPTGAVNSLKKIFAFTRRHDCNAELNTQNGSFIHLATITPKTEIPNQYPLIGETILYGKIKRVGGSEPKIRFETVDGKTLYCSTSEKIAMKAGTRLYTQVGLRGLAEWNTETFEIEYFRVDEILDYEQITISESFKELSKVVGDSFNDIDDVNRNVIDMRYGSSEV